jgi:hypothetical protein
MFSDLMLVLVFSRGVIQNFLDFFEIRISRRWRASDIDWMRVYDMDEVRSELFSSPSTNCLLV